MRSIFVLAVTAVAVSSSLSAQTAVTKLEAVSAPSPIDKTTQTEDVKFETERYDRMTVPVIVSGTGPYRFLVDTGADRTAISTDIAATYEDVRKIDDAHLELLHQMMACERTARQQAAAAPTSAAPRPAEAPRPRAKR